jgi:hypothetical protein
LLLLATGLFSDPPHPRSVPPAPSPARRSPGSPPAPWFAIVPEPMAHGGDGARGFTPGNGAAGQGRARRTCCGIMPARQAAAISASADRSRR